MPAAIFNWSDSRDLEHHCGVCQTPMSSDKAKKTCYGEHCVPCSRYHQIFFWKDAWKKCSLCSQENEMHRKRHKEIAGLLQDLHDLCGPPPEEASTPTRRGSGKERFRVHSLVKVGNTQIEGVAILMHPPGHGMICKRYPVDLAFITAASQIPIPSFAIDIDKVLVHLLRGIKVNDGRRPAQTLCERLKESVNTDFVHVFREECMLIVRREGFLRHAGRSSYELCVNHHSLYDLELNQLKRNKPASSRNRASATVDKGTSNASEKLAVIYGADRCDSGEADLDNTEGDSKADTSNVMGDVDSGIDSDASARFEESADEDEEHPDESNHAEDGTHCNVVADPDALARANLERIAQLVSLVSLSDDQRGTVYIAWDYKYLQFIYACFDTRVSGTTYAEVVQPTVVAWTQGLISMQELFDYQRHLLSSVIRLRNLLNEALPNPDLFDKAEMSPCPGVSDSPPAKLGAGVKAIHRLAITQPFMRNVVHFRKVWKSLCSVFQKKDSTMFDYWKHPFLAWSKGRISVKTFVDRLEPYIQEVPVFVAAALKLLPPPERSYFYRPTGVLRLKAGTPQEMVFSRGLSAHVHACRGTRKQFTTEQIDDFVAWCEDRFDTTFFISRVLPSLHPDWALIDLALDSLPSGSSNSYPDTIVKAQEDLAVILEVNIQPKHEYAKQVACIRAINPKEYERMIKKLKTVPQLPHPDKNTYLSLNQANFVKRAVRSTAYRCMEADIPIAGGMPKHLDHAEEHAWQMYRFKLTAGISTHVGTDHSDNDLRKCIKSDSPFCCAVCDHEFVGPEVIGNCKPNWDSIARSLARAEVGGNPDSITESRPGQTDKSGKASATNFARGLYYDRPPCTCIDDKCAKKFHVVEDLLKLLEPLRGEREPDLTRPQSKELQESPRFFDGPVADTVNKTWDDWRLFETTVDTASIHHCAMAHILATQIKNPHYPNDTPRIRGGCKCGDCLLFSPSSQPPSCSKHDPLEVPSRVLFVSGGVFGPNMTMGEAIAYTRGVRERHPDTKERVMIIHDDLLVAIRTGMSLHALCSWASINAQLRSITIFQLCTLLRLTGPKPLSPFEEAAKNVGQEKKMWNYCYCGCQAYGSMVQCAMRGCLAENFHEFCIQSSHLAASDGEEGVRVWYAPEETEVGQWWFCLGCEKKLREKVAKEF